MKQTTKEATTRARSDWARLTENENSAELKKVIGAMTYKASGKILAAVGNPATAQRVITQNIEDIYNDTFINACEIVRNLDNLNEHREKKGRDALNISLIIYRAAEKSIRSYVTAQNRRAANVAEQLDALEGLDRDIMDIATSHQQRDPARIYEIKEAIKNAARDDIDAAIIAGMLHGETGTDIADALHLNPSSVSRRMRDIRDRIRAAV